MESKIFKAYDIRGIYPEELNEETAYKIGAAFAVFIKNVSKKEIPQVVVGKDNRLSSPSLCKELIRGIIDMGANVIDIGLSTTPLLYFSVANYNYDAGINVTASHNPSQFNGFKLVREKAIPISENTGIREIKEIVLSGNFIKNKKIGEITKINPIQEYLKSKDGLGGIKVVVDTANSVSGILVSEMFKGINLVHIFKELDSNFPNHEPDPLKKENIKDLQSQVIKSNADIGIAFDGDGDRVFFVDEKGEIITSDLILSLISSIILRQNKGAKILYDIRSSNIARETIEQLGGIAIPVRVGHSFIKAKMREENAVFAAEYAGHFYLKQNDSYFEDPYFVIFSLIEEMKESGKKLSQLIDPFKKYYHSGEINFKVEDKDIVIEKIRQKYSQGNISTIDGIRIDFDDWWFSVRGSNTEPLLRFILEAKTKELMEEKIKEIEGIIKQG
ncbi:MAG: phosphomannomutase/phosphoglucomutase [Candidatus Pacebacteria bacterium]|nr:phosphomannomutase/phosphoglucomutase [Candidatus Paceibacterota bacterium]